MKEEKPGAAAAAAAAAATRDRLTSSIQETKKNSREESGEIGQTAS